MSSSWDTYQGLLSHAKLEKPFASTKNPHSQAHKAINSKNKAIWFDPCQPHFVKEFQRFFCASNASIIFIHHHPPGGSDI